MKAWMFTNNPFMATAKRSYKQATKISTYHDAQLQAQAVNDPFFVPLYNSYHAAHETLNSNYTTWLSQGGTQKGSTLSVDQLLVLLSPKKVNGWEYSIQGIFEKASPEYVALFPQGRYPFNTGSKESRIAAVEQLSKSLTGITQLEAVKTDVDSFYRQLTSKRQVQLGHKGDTGSKSNAIEMSVEAAMTEMYSNLGLLISHYKNNLSLIGMFFDLDTIRNHDQLVFNKTVKPKKISNIMQHTFTASDSLTIINDGNTSLEFYLAPDNKAAHNGTPTFKLLPNTQQTIAITQLGDIANTFVNVLNDNTIDGHCTIDLL
jgi:hypothetical protein